MERRIFHFSEGTSNKFWSIETNGTKTLVHFGKVGTAGQAQEKEWLSEAAALTAATKLITEKTKKGYTEQTGTAASAVAPPAPAAIVRAPAKPKAAGSSPAAPATASTAVASVTGPPDSTNSLPATIPELLPDGTLQLESRIDLGEQDWWWTVKQPRRVLPMREARPFDREACLKLAKEITGDTAYTYNWKWHLLAIMKQVLSPEESAFWLYLGSFGRFTDIKTIHRLIGEWKWVPGSKDHKRAFEVAARYLPGSHRLPLMVGVLGLEGALDSCGAFDACALRRFEVTEYTKAFRDSVLPYLAQEQIDALLIRLRALPPMSQPPDKYAPFPFGAYLLALLGDGSDVQKIIATIPNESYSFDNGWEDDYYQRPQHLIFGLGTPAEIITETRRIGVRLRESDYVMAWLATTEFSDLDFVVQSILQESNRDEATKLMRPFLKVHAVEAVPAMFRLMLESKAPAFARQWLVDHPAHAITGAVSLASGRGKIAEAAMEFLAESVARGHRPIIEAALKTLPAEQAALIAESSLAQAETALPCFDADNTPEWLGQGLPALKGPPIKIPGNIPAVSLPQVVVGPFALNPLQLASLIHILATAPVENPPAILALLKQHAHQASLDALVWKLFNAWMTDGAPPKQKWALLSLGDLGGDAIALKLVPLIRKWPGESQHQRAVLGLQVLRMIGTDTALMQLNGIAQKLPFKGLKERAKELMEEIAQSRGLTKAELEDRIVPDCGLDERGSRSFDFGPRQFELLLGSDLKPVIRDASGKKRPDLPAPNAADDPSLAAEAVADWKLLKKNLREVLKIQTERLEQAMITGRRWTVDEFHTLFVRHPLMTHLSRWVIWACYAPEGKVAATFRVNDDQTLTDSSDDPFALPPGASIGIVHPLQLDEAVKNAWGEVQGDYEIISPFPQLGRPLFALQPDEKSADTIHRGKGKKIAAGSMFGVFEKNGWIRDSPADAGGYAAHSKPFPAANLTAFAHYDPGLWVGGSMAEMDDQEITEVYFVPGLRGPDWWSAHKDRIPLAKVDAIVLSEVLRDIETILGKAK